MCGGTISSISISRRERGLSPRVRGNLHERDRKEGDNGSIPACAGEPIERMICQSSDSGLSPRVRGNPEALPRSFEKVRSIPACAGEPIATTPSSSRIRVYPRVCGGTDKPGFPVLAATGLSPRVRGNRGHSPLGDDRCGSIPACAGEPLQLTRKDLNGRSIPACAGEPPSQLSVRINAGSIPACAGEPSGERTTLWHMVYPRVCGGTHTCLYRQTSGTVYPRVCGGTVHKASYD